MERKLTMAYFEKNQWTYVYIYAAQGKVGSFPVLFETCWRLVVSVRVSIAVLEINILF